MKTKLLFIGGCVCLFTQLSYGQSQTNLLKETTLTASLPVELNTQRAKLEAKQAEIDQSVATSRAQVNKLNDEFSVLKEEYLRLLSIELAETSDVHVKEQLQREITRYTQVANSSTH